MNKDTLNVMNNYVDSFNLDSNAKHEFIEYLKFMALLEKNDLKKYNIAKSQFRIEKYLISTLLTSSAIFLLIRYRLKGQFSMSFIYSGIPLYAFYIIKYYKEKQINSVVNSLSSKYQEKLFMFNKTNNIFDLNKDFLEYDPTEINTHEFQQLQHQLREARDRNI
jgi:hypothetical protein